ncbi:helix-turn-helix domain-containing protein, partial [Acinetobacter baumannii]
MSLDALAMILKVTPAKLAALEEGHLDQLPDANFARALAQTICRALKIDAAPVLAALPAARPSPLGTDKPPLN